MKYAPQLATLVKAPPSGDEWLPRDQVRRLSHRLPPRTATASRSSAATDNDWTAAFPEIVDAGAGLRLTRRTPRRRSGRRAARRANQLPGPAATVAPGPRHPWCTSSFDLLRLDGETLEAAAACRAQGAAEGARSPRETAASATRITSSAAAPRCLEQACRLGLEGIISKRSDRPYSTGRNGDWRQDEVHAAAGVRHRRLHRSGGHARGPRRAARRLLRAAPAGLRRQGRHRLHARVCARTAATAGPDRAQRQSVRSSSPARHRAAGPLGASPTRVRGDLHRVDRRRDGASSLVSGTAQGQEGPGRTARGT